MAYLLHHLLIWELILFAQFVIVKAKINVRCEKSKMHLAKTSWQQGIKMAKNVFSKKSQIKANLDNATDNSLKHTASII